MNSRKYFDLIVLVILLEILSNSSADEWKKLKRKLFALTLLHGIRVKTIIPLPVPLPLPIVIKKYRTPIVLPPKRVPFLVPKPVPYYQIIPKFVPIYPKEADSNEKHWSEEDSLLSAPQMTHEDYLLPSADSSGFLDQNIYKLSAGDVQHPEFEHTIDHHNKFNRVPHKFHNDEFIDPFEQNSKHKFPNKRKMRKSKPKPFDGLKQFNYNEDNGEKYDDLLMVSSAQKSEPQDRTATQRPYSNGQILTDNRDLNNERFPTGLTAGYELNKQLLSDSKPNIDKTEGNGSQENHFIQTDSSGVKTTTKKVKVGEIRLRHNELKALLSHHNHN